MVKHWPIAQRESEVAVPPVFGKNIIKRNKCQSKSDIPMGVVVVVAAVREGSRVGQKEYENRVLDWYSI